MDERSARFTELFDANLCGVLAYSLRRVGDPADAADVAADTFLVAWRRLDEVPAGAEARPWLFGVARRVLANHDRSRRRRDRLADGLRERLTRIALPDPADGVVQAAALRAGLAALHPDDRELLGLTAWEGLTPNEIALVVDIPAATVRTRLHRARNRLRAQLDAERERSTVVGHVLGDGCPPVADAETQ